MSKITTLFWDVGGVLLSNGWDRESREAACKHFGLDEQEFEKRHALVDDAFEKGRITLDGYLDATVFYVSRPFSRKEIADFIFAQSQPNNGTLHVLGAIAAGRHYLLATINNEAAELNTHRIRAFQLRRYFTAFLSSCYLGVRKPDPGIFELALGITQRAPEECVFIDDRPENLEPARRLGMHTIHFENPSQLQEALRDCGVRYELASRDS